MNITQMLEIADKRDCEENIERMEAKLREIVELMPSIVHYLAIIKQLSNKPIPELDKLLDKLEKWRDE